MKLRDFLQVAITPLIPGDAAAAQLRRGMLRLHPPSYLSLACILDPSNSTVLYVFYKFLVFSQEVRQGKWCMYKRQCKKIAKHFYCYTLRIQGIYRGTGNRTLAEAKQTVISQDGASAENWNPSWKNKDEKLSGIFFIIFLIFTLTNILQFTSTLQQNSPNFIQVQCILDYAL